MEVGFIGLGVMGAPMASRLTNAGHSIVTSLNRSKTPDVLARRPVTIVGSPAEVADRCDVVITMLPDTPDVEKVMLASDGVIEAIGERSLIIDMSSISPITTREIALAVKAKGANYLDAPVSGGEVGARAGTLSIMVGGDRAAFDRAMPIFEVMGKNITLISEDNGAGQICKLANQIIVALNIEAVGEALVLAAKAGCDPAVIRKALMGGFASSRVLEVHGERMINRTFDPGFSIKLHQKDLGLALGTARSLGVSLPNTASCQELFNSCAARGEGGLDHSALVRSLETLAAHRLDS